MQSIFLKNNSYRFEIICELQKKAADAFVGRKTLTTQTADVESLFCGSQCLNAVSCIVGATTNRIFDEMRIAIL